VPLHYVLHPRLWLERPQRLGIALFSQSVVIAVSIIYQHQFSDIRVFPLILLPMVFAASEEPALGLLTGAMGAAAFIYIEGLGVKSLVVSTAWLATVHLVATTAVRSQDRQRELLNSLLMAEDEERGRLASDLHDDSIQVLTAALLSLDRLEPDAKRHPSYQKAYTLMREALTGLRTLTFRLRPPVLEHGGLRVALGELCHSYRVQFADMGATFDWAIDLPVTPSPQIADLAHRVVGELLSNAWKHAHATTVHLGAHVHEGWLEITVVDNGSGFDASALHRPGHHWGLPAKMERVRFAGGTLRFSSGPRGTVATLRLPCVIK
jgi:signal transduction histidine kinase